MSEASGVALRPAQAFGRRQGRADKRLEDHLRDAFAFAYSICRPAGIQEKNAYFPPIIRIDHADALSDRYAFNGTEAASGVDESRRPFIKRLNGHGE
jgi:hypothetical protein